MNNLTYEETMLYIMYNDNIRHIQQLIDSNNVIRDNIINGSYFLRNNTTTNRRRNRNRNRQTNNSQNNNVTNNNSTNNYNTPNSNYYTPNSNYYRHNPNYYSPNYYSPNYYLPPNYYTPNYYTPNYYLPPVYYRPNYHLQNSNYNANSTLRFQPSNMLYQGINRGHGYRPPTPPLYTLQRQIELSTQNARYGDLVSPLHTICPISHEPFNENSQVTIIRHCGHIFNTPELNTWFSNNSVCPVCRYDVRNYRRPYPPQQEQPPQEQEQPQQDQQQQNRSNDNLIRRTRRNYVSFIDISLNNLTDVDSITNDILNIFNSVLLSDPSYNNSYFI